MNSTSLKNVPSRPWYKITFDSGAPGHSLVIEGGRKRLKRVAGRWVVFDKNDRRGPPWLFDGETAEACFAWIEAKEGRAA